MEIYVHKSDNVDACKDEIIYGLKALRTVLIDGLDGYMLSVKTSFRDTLTDTSMDIGRFLIRKRNGEVFSFRIPYKKRHMYMFTDFCYGCNIAYIDTVIPELNELCEIVVTAYLSFKSKYYNWYDVNLDSNTITKGDNENEDL